MSRSCPIRETRSVPTLSPIGVRGSGKPYCNIVAKGGAFTNVHTLMKSVTWRAFDRMGMTFRWLAIHCQCPSDPFASLAPVLSLQARRPSILTVTLLIAAPTLFRGYLKHRKFSVPAIFRSVCSSWPYGPGPFITITLMKTKFGISFWRPWPDFSQSGIG